MTLVGDRRMRGLEREAKAGDPEAAEKLKKLRARRGIEHYEVCTSAQSMLPNERVSKECRRYEAALPVLEALPKWIQDDQTGKVWSSRVLLCKWAKLDTEEYQWYGESEGPRWHVTFSGLCGSQDMSDVGIGRYKPGNVRSIIRRLEKEYAWAQERGKAAKERQAKQEEAKAERETKQEVIVENQERLAGFLAVQGFEVETVTTKTRYRSMPKAGNAAVKLGAHKAFISLEREGLVHLNTKAYLTPEGLTRVLAVVAEEEAKAELVSPKPEEEAAK